ncbi:chaplin [Streptomyces sp. NPDC015171]|uniref:chaplin n=1 Tax=Streptomyces sp. NPDC015171 TaxID=3364945 RepID=UPI003700D2F5
MRRATRNGVIAVAAMSGAMAVALPVSAAFAAGGADAHGAAAGSPGLASGNDIQVPVNVPVNICGNTANVVGLLNPAMGNACANRSGGKSGGAVKSGGSAKAGGSGKSGGSSASGGASARGGAEGSPGLLSGNSLQLPVDVPVNITGNSVNVVGVGNPAVGNESVNGPDEPSRHIPAPRPRAAKPPAHIRSHPGPAAASLAHTGADLTVPTAAGGAVLLVAGATLYRRFRPGRVR